VIWVDREHAQVKPGIRLQLVVLLAGLMVLAFVPLYFAVAGLTQTTLRNARASSARALGRAVGAHVSESRRTRADHELQALLDAEIGAVGLEAVAVYSRDGRVLAKAGEFAAVPLLPASVPPETERTQTLSTPKGPALEVLIPGDRGPVVALLRIDDEAGRAGPLLRLVALYTCAFAVALLLFTYMALTRMLVRPIDQLSEVAG